MYTTLLPGSTPRRWAVFSSALTSRFSSIFAPGRTPICSHISLKLWSFFIFRENLGTKVPFPCLRTTSPFSVREPMAFRTVMRLTP